MFVQELVKEKEKITWWWIARQEEKTHGEVFRDIYRRLDRE